MFSIRFRFYGADPVVCAPRYKDVAPTEPFAHRRRGDLEVVGEADCTERLKSGAFTREKASDASGAPRFSPHQTSVPTSLPLALSFRNPSRDGIHDFIQGSILFDHQGVVRHFQCG
jgi:hypothetical protein